MDPARFNGALNIGHKFLADEDYFSDNEPVEWNISLERQPLKPLPSSGSLDPYDPFRAYHPSDSIYSRSSKCGDYFLFIFDEAGKFPCNLCSRAIKVTRYLTTMDGETLYGCDVCPAFFLTGRELLDHKCEYHSRNYDYLCRLCRHFYHDPDGLASHVSTHSENLGERCEICQVISKPLKQEEIGLDVKKYVCMYCKKKFQNQSLLSEHMRSHKRERRYNCSHCAKQFSKLRLLELHIRDHDKNVWCDYCKENLTGSLKRHIKKAHPEKMLNCPKCYKICVDTESLNSHHLKKHGMALSLSDVKAESDFDSDRALDTWGSDAPIDVLDVNLTELKPDIEPDSDRKLRTTRLRYVKRKLPRDEGNDDYECEKCNKSYTSKKRLRIHMQNHFKQYCCTVCKRKFAVEKNLTTHMEIHSGEETPNQCKICSASFKRHSNLQSHMQRHTGNKRFQCTECSKGFYSGQHLKCHMRTHTGERPFHCTMCSRSFTSSGNLVRHRLTHTGEKPFQCEYCPKAFTQATSLKFHRRRHTGDAVGWPRYYKKFTCQYCSKSYASLKTLEEHIRVHSGERPFKCDECDKTFSSSNSFKVHKMSHLTVKPFICNYCGKGFSQSGTFNLHLRKHTGEKPYKCQTCGKAFSQNGNLKLHMRKHTGEKPYVCQTCGKCFSNSANLTRHQTVHTGERRHVCTECGKCFSQKRPLIDHMNIHTGAKPHKCVHCDSTFANPSTLNRHLKTHMKM